MTEVCHFPTKRFYQICLKAFNVSINQNIKLKKYPVICRDDSQPLLAVNLSQLCELECEVT